MTCMKGTSKALWLVHKEGHSKFEAFEDKRVLVWPVFVPELY